MTTIAKINLPACMCPPLAGALGATLATNASRPELANFIALAVLFHSWRVAEQSTLEDAHTQLSHTVLSPFTDNAVEAMADVPTYRQALEARRAERARAIEAVHAARQLRSLLAGADEARLKHGTAEVLKALSTMELAQARSLFDTLHETITRWHPEVGDVNEMLLWKGVAGADTESSVEARSKPDEDSPAVVFGPDGKAHAFPNAAQALAFVVSQALQGRRLLGRGAAEKPDAQGPGTALTAQEPVDPTKPALRVFNPAAAIEKLQSMGPAGMGEGNSQQRKLLDAMANDDGLRALSEVPEGNPLAELYERFPHFGDVLDFITKSLALAGCGDEGRPARIPPILLRGEPGSGKTYFAQEVARLLGSHFVERDLSVTSEAFVISGMDSAWKGSKPGVVFEALVKGKTANPVILLNEVDKAVSRSTHNSPISAMYALLEPTSAARFVDEFVPVEIDASRVIWMLTANNGDIPEPVLSRLEVFDIRQPNHDECRAIAQSVWTGICSRTLPHGHGFATQLDETMLDAVAMLSPRVMRKALTLAASSAVVAGRKHLLLEDLEGSQKRYAPVEPRRSIGFLTN